jgi:hypothetical protein
MNFLISILVAARSLTFVTSFLGDPGTNTRFLDPVLVIKGQEVMLSCFLENAYSEDLRKIASTGTAVPLYIYVNLKEENGDRVLRQKVIETQLRYDLIGKRYLVTQSVSDDTLFFAGLDSAAVASCRIKDCPVFRAEGLSRDESYIVEMYAVLGKVTVAALSGNEVDLMYYWDFKRPLLRTEPLPGTQLIR